MQLSCRSLNIILFVYRVPLLSPTPAIKIEAVSRWCQVFFKSAKWSPVQRLQQRSFSSTSTWAEPSAMLLPVNSTGLSSSVGSGYFYQLQVP